MLNKTEDLFLTKKLARIEENVVSLILLFLQTALADSFSSFLSLEYS